MYKEKRQSRSEFVPIRGLAYHVRIWPAALAETTAAPLVLVHGWMDVAASWQFMVDAFDDAFLAGRCIIAPDWRGFGLTQATNGGEATTAGGPSSPAGAAEPALPGRRRSAPSGGSAVREATSVGADIFWFPDYLADLDFLLDHFSPAQPVDLVGHSMGGNVAMMYAGARPGRIRKLVNLEGFGLAASEPAQAPARYASWMDALKTLHRGELDLKAYPDASGVARRLMKTNPRLTPDKADWLASHWARPDESGQWRILGNAGHKVPSASLYRVDEALAMYRAIRAPVLAVEADGDSLHAWWKGKYTLADYHQRLQQVPNARVAVLADAGHMLHHDQPEALAGLIEGFLAD